MEKRFQNKKIAFLGASIIQNGKFLSYMRNYLLNNTEEGKATFFNCGLGGNRSIMAQYLLKDDVLPLKPDYCFIHFGVNDMGVWLYEYAEKELQSILIDRQQRDALYFEGMKRTVEILRDNGVEPILCSPIAVNEYLLEKDDIQTIADNEEKGAMINEKFYKRKTFENINRTLEKYSKTLNKYADNERVLFFDLYSKSHAKMKTTEGLYEKDGIHLTALGQETLGKCFLEYLGCKKEFSDFDNDTINEEIAQKEALIRKIQYVKWAMFNPFLGYEEEELDKNIKDALREDLPRHKIAAIQAYLEHGNELSLLQSELVVCMSEYNR